MSANALPIFFHLHANYLAANRGNHDFELADVGRKKRYSIGRCK